MISVEQLPPHEFYGKTGPNSDTTSANGLLLMTNYETARTAMVDCQVRPSDVTRYTVIDAMLSTKREAFVPSQLRDVAYAGDHIPLGEGRVVLDPRVTGKMLDVLALTKDDLVLDIGCGHGYIAALCGHMAEAVIAVDAQDAFVAAATQALVAHEADNVVVEKAELTEGTPAHGPYDAILIEGAVETVPDALLAQLKEGGRIAAIFLDGDVGQCRLGVMSGGAVTWRRAFDATAPLLPGFSVEKAFVF